MVCVGTDDWHFVATRAPVTAHVPASAHFAMLSYANSGVAASGIDLGCSACRGRRHAGCPRCPGLPWYAPVFPRPVPAWRPPENLLGTVTPPIRVGNRPQ
jgi:hypothetical protein